MSLQPKQVSGIAIVQQHDDAVTSAVTDAAILDHSTSGVAAAGIGTGILLRTENAAGTLGNAARISGIYTTVTGGAEVSALLFETRTAGGALAERARITGAGTLLVGVTAAVSSEKIRTSGGIQASGSIQLEGAADVDELKLSVGDTETYIEMNDGGSAAVSAASRGRLRYDVVSNKFQVSLNGAAYVNLATGAGTTPGGADTQIQYNNAGAFGGAAEFIWDDIAPVKAVLTQGTFQIRTTTGGFSADIDGQVTHLRLASDSNDANLTLEAHITGSSNIGVNAFFSRGTAASQIAVTNGDKIAIHNGYGYVGATNKYLQSCAIRFEVGGTINDIGTGRCPGKIVFATFQNQDSGSITDAVSVDSSQRLNVGVGGASEKLTVEGRIRSTNSDIAVEDNARGLILKDTQGTPHYWRVTVSTLGILTTSDLGTSLPAE